ncbi:MAG: RNA polymerase sporulation sigma factor SigH [Clostridia bacterium]|nr:RNA polymerase sporulation sigma factor SigH [Clostridia bacterium]
MTETDTPYFKQYLDKADDELVELAKTDECAFEFLVTKYKCIVLSKARGYFLVGADREDIIQEGMIGLVKAIRDYKCEREASFKGFAEICINRQIITAIKSATRQKHLPLNTYISFSCPVYDNNENGESRTVIDIIESDSSDNPEERVLIEESYRGMDEKIMKTLSKYEKKVLEFYLGGCTYMEISEKTGKPVKSIDNALQRIKKKLEKYYNELMY